MHRALSVERSARLKSEQRYETEVGLRERAERDLAAVRSELERVEEAHKELIATTAEALADNLSRFSQVLANQQSLSLVPTSLNDGSSAASRSVPNNSTGKEKMRELPR